MHQPHVTPNTIKRPLSGRHPGPKKATSRIPRHYILSDTIDNHKEISPPLAEGMVTCNRLKLFWGKRETPSNGKVTVFNSVLKSKVLYGFETIQLTTNDISKLSAFQVKGLARILHLPHTFIDRTYSNQRVLDILRNTHQNYVEKLSDTWLPRKVKLLGHILRSQPNDPNETSPVRTLLLYPAYGIPKTRQTPCLLARRNF